jgi:hypothetical protein
MGLDLIESNDKQRNIPESPAQIEHKEVPLPKDLILSHEQQAAYKDFDKSFSALASVSVDSPQYKDAAEKLGKDLQALLSPAQTRQRMMGHLNEVIKENLPDDHHFSVVSGKDKAGSQSAGILYRDQSGWDLATGMMPGTTVLLDAKPIMAAKKGN